MPPTKVFTIQLPEIVVPRTLNIVLTDDESGDTHRESFTVPEGKTWADLAEPVLARVLEICKARGWVGPLEATVEVP